MRSNMLLIPHPQLKPSHLTMSGSRSCPNFSHPAPCLTWRNPDSVVLTVQPSPALSRLTGQCYMLRLHVALKTGQNPLVRIKWQTSGKHWLHTCCIKHIILSIICYDTAVNLAFELWFFFFMFFLHRHQSKGNARGNVKFSGSTKQ